jgi:hypothetical protein
VKDGDDSTTRATSMVETVANELKYCLATSSYDRKS